MRQVFSNVFYALANNEGIKNIFVGGEGRRLPVFSNELVVNGFFETLGKMIAHSLVQGGPGFLTSHRRSTGTWQQGIFKLLCRVHHAQMWITLTSLNTSQGYVFDFTKNYSRFNYTHSCIDSYRQRQ